MKKIIKTDNEKDIYFYYYKDDCYKLYRKTKNRLLPLKDITHADISKRKDQQTSKAINSLSNLWVKLPEIGQMISKTDPDYKELNTDIEKYVKRVHDIFIKDATTIKELTNGQINLFKIGDFKKAALHFFYETVKDIQPEPIEDDEAEFISKSTIGQVIWCQKNYKGNSHHYDFKSYYCSILQRQQAKYPIKRGEFKTITQKEFDSMEYVKFGIYKAKVITDHQLYRVNPENYYTHSDLQLARDLNMDIEIVECKNNFLYYSSDKLVNGNKIFKEYVSTLFPLRKKAHCAKIILNILWGALTEKTSTLNEYDFNDVSTIPSNAIIKEMYPSNNNTVMVRYTLPNEKMYKHDYGRIGTFLLSYGRKQIIKTVQPFLNDVVYINTDGFRCKTKQDLTTGDELGDLKYEGSDNVHILNTKKIIKI
jgi:hypothetical protein